MGWVDGALLAVVLISAVVGLKRGLVLELLSLLAWVVAAWAAWQHWPWTAQWLVGMGWGQGSGAVEAPGLGSIDPAMAALQPVAMLITFVAVLIVWGLAARLVKLLLHATPLSVIDRAFGVLFGLLRGLILAVLVVVVVAMTPWAKSEAWAQSTALKQYRHWQDSEAAQKVNRAWHHVQTVIIQP